jgi:predicted nuclease of predicted toxin-antitoxin system
MANENFPGPVVRALRLDGHDVMWIRESAPGVADTDVLRLAATEERIVATRDKDFGSLVFREGVPAPNGIILIRLPDRPHQLAAAVVAALRGDHPWTGHFATIEPGRIRMRELRKPQPP